MHRFGINFHRLKRSKGTFKNQLEGIDGIGRNTADLLLKTFRSVNKIKQTSELELASVVGNAKAKIITGYFEKQKEEK